MFGSRARVGLIVPSGNGLSEPEFRMMAPAGVEFYGARLRLPATGGPDRYFRMVDHLEFVADLLADLHPAYILFHCTAASVAGGPGYDAQLIERIQKVAPCSAGTTATGLVQALRAFGAHKVALITPYVPSTNAAEVRFFEGNGFQVVEDVALSFSREQMRDTPPDEWLKLVEAADTSRADAILLSCTAVQTVAAVDRIEQRLGLPVVTSNQAGLWYVLRSLGLDDAIEGYGALLREKLALPEAEAVAAGT